MKKLVKESLEDATVMVTFEADAGRRDHKILSLCKEVGDAHYSGGIGLGSCWRSIYINGAKKEDVEKVLQPYILRAVILSINYLGE